ncbi:MAG: bacillithiol biosynthesis deacetylase BshB1 [Lewinellaceae bacterium]|nr:bacillithiol biosynthesis deacetylase BshB1 [Lewinellaceae bacterium]HPQ98237.1 bacillithiol biosynthesis deacetylase BshB1 [Saprospiraceae bacterium]HQU53183.1 bacillithiol biosynthesis deacetylase BshB1 [Saprospiraceae bacterium]
MKVDILAIGVHPDDVELCCSGTILKHIADGYKVGILDLTRGELGTRGTPEIRAAEAAEGARIMGVEFRNNIGLADGFFDISEASMLPIIEFVRYCQPDIVLANAIKDRHPDHGRASALVEQACFLAGLHRIETYHEGVLQVRWRPKAIYHYIQDFQLTPDLIVDITAHMDKKMEAILAFRSQFYDPNSPEPSSPISGKEFLNYVKSVSSTMGRRIGATYGEGFNVMRPIGVDDLVQLG